MASIPNFIPSSEWLDIRWGDSRPENVNRGKPQPFASYASIIDREHHSDEGVKRYHSRMWRIVFRSIYIPRAMSDFLGGV